MGEVYRATDTRLEREVALKVLPASMHNDAGRLARFRREATIIAALNHPNIVTIYSVEEADGMPFLTMELVEGQTLDALLPAHGLPLEQLFELGLPIADAITSAHGRGVVHRDLKPSNVMVTDEGGRVKVLDFGLAKLSAAEAGTLDTHTGTKAGMILGTPHYMSPEQARSAVVDHRSDIFSLGVLLFEMATGTRPFKGGSSVEVLSAVLKDAPPALRDVKPELPRHLSRIIDRCLEKVPADRYQTARDVYNELRALRKETAIGAERGAGQRRQVAHVGRAAIREPGWRSRRRLFQRRPRRRVDQCPWRPPRGQGHRAQLVLPVSRTERDVQGDRAPAGRRHRARGQRPRGEGPTANHGRARELRQRLADLVATLRP